MKHAPETAPLPLSLLQSPPLAERMSELERRLAAAEDAWNQGRRRSAREAAERVLADGRAEGLTAIEARAHLCLTRITFGESSLSAARAHIDEAMRLFAEREPRLEAIAHLWLALIGVHTGAPDAVRHARRAVMMGEALRDPELICLARAQLGSVLVERRLHEEARAVLQLARQDAKRLALPENECRALVYSAMLELDAGRPLQASFLLAGAREISASLGRVARGIVSGSLGVVHLLRGYVRAARAALIEADLLLEDVGNRHARTTFLAFLGAAEATVGHPSEARVAFAAARDLVQGGDETHYAGHIVRLLECVLHLAAGRGAEQARARLAELDAGEPSPASEWADLRVAAAYVRRLLLGAHPVLPLAEPRPGLLVARDASWFRLEMGPLVDLRRRALLRRLLACLVRERVELPGSSVDRGSLARAGWPDAERLELRAFVNRINVAIATLRSLGLRSVLVTAGDGYRLREDVEVTVEEPPDAR